MSDNNKLLFYATKFVQFVIQQKITRTPVINKKEATAQVYSWKCWKQKVWKIEDPKNNNCSHFHFTILPTFFFSSQNLLTKAVKDNKQISGKHAQLELHGRINVFTLTKSQTYLATNAQAIYIFLKGM